MSDVLMSFPAATEILDVYEDKITITANKKSAIGDRTFFMSQISGVQLKKGTTFEGGYLYFNLPGGKNKPSFSPLKLALTENAVMFNKKQNDLAEKVKIKIEELITQSAASSENYASGADEILKYKNLLEQGIITQEEFNNKKKQILNL